MMSKNMRYSAARWYLFVLYSLALQSFAQRPLQLELELAEERELVKDSAKDLQKKQEKKSRYVPALIAATACAVGILAVCYGIPTKPMEEAIRRDPGDSRGYPSLRHPLLKSSGQGYKRRSAKRSARKITQRLIRRNFEKIFPHLVKK